DLVKDLKSELGGKLEDLIMALMSPPRVYDADLLHKAIKGAGTDDKVLVEILASRTPEQIKEIIKIYKKEHGGKLEKDIMGDTSGHYQRLLLMLLQGEREEGVDESRVEKDAKELFAAGAKKAGTDEEKFVQILGRRSIEHLRQVFDVYKKIASCDIEESICGEFTGILETLLLAVVKCAKSVPGYFAYSLRDCMRRAGTDDETLIRIMVSRSEEDMLDIRAQYKKMYGESLYRTIQAGATRSRLITLIYRPHPHTHTQVKDDTDAGKMGKRKDLSEFDKDQIVMARPLDQSISKTAALVGYSTQKVDQGRNSGEPETGSWAAKAH
ncbi:hypothetical protein QTP86_024845, partial [Hemibagrus guttatus]